MTACLLLPGLAVATTPLGLGFALFLFGIAVGFMDVSMNIAAVAVTRVAERPLMSFFHAGFSAGALWGGGGAALAAALNWAPGRQFVTATLAGVVVLCLTVRFLPASLDGPARVATADDALTRPSPARQPVL
ncbi:hypothetical protein GCM10012275_21590 [Longimycelium tulufanense]|uniref:MFS transporter n=1 Tax=Longimycelium tulufanense TaxID=907463 RepID=A0A8J3FTL1_9PSEU|nr:hypothetical protein [Longimycelium tulufanense]GGM50384.1 hypothetical protein GCM10012275_21590 [Longimycelium tulufanense]